MVRGKNNYYRIVKKLLLTALLASALLPLSAESKAEFDLELYNTVYKSGDDYFISGNGTAGMSYKTIKNRNVKGNIELDFYPNDVTGEHSDSLPLFELKKAYVKVRMPDHRLTLGKTRTTWGEGVVFNSGDVIFGSLNPHVDLTKKEKRSETSWMTVTNTPLGSFSFVELIFVPPQTETTEDGFKSSYPGGRADKSSAGGRIYTQMGGTKVEAGYLYKGEKRTTSDPDTATHRPYISFQGNIGPDWSLSSSAAIPAELHPDMDFIKKSFSVSFSLFQIFNIDHDSSLNVRLEGLLLPWHNWEETTLDIEEGKAYGIFLYPEIAYNISPGLSLSLQSVISPIDLSAMTTLGFFWNIYQDLEILNYLTVNGGEQYDVFPWDGSRDIVNASFTSGFRYRF